MKSIFSKIYLPIFVLWGLFISGCSDELDVHNGYTDVPSNSIRLDVYLPESSIVRTKAEQSDDEMKIGSAKLFIFKSDGNYLTTYNYTENDFTAGVNTQSLYITLSTTENNLSLYLIANGGNELSNFSGTLSELEATTVSIANGASLSSPFVMSGKVTGASTGSSVSVNLNRLAAKVTMSGGANLEEEGYTVDNFYIGKISTGVKLKDPEPLSSFTFEQTTHSNSATSSGIGESNPLYVYPSLGAGKENRTPDNGAYVVLKATNTKSSNAGYFCIFLKNDKGFLDLNPNHWYQITIDHIYTDGHPNAADAIANPEVDQIHIEYTIHDHAAKVMSMTTDGIRELATDREVNLDNSKTQDVISLRLYSIHPDEISGLAAIPSNIEEVTSLSDPINVEVTEGKQWLVISNVVKKDLELSGEYEDDEDDISKKTAEYEYTIKVKDDIILPTSQTGKIKFEWLGLTREVTVEYKIEFNPRKVCIATLTIKNGETTEGTMNETYWDFISGNGTVADKNSNVGSISYLFGIKPEDNADGKERNEGLHFPMPYGDDPTGAPWKYEYTLDFSPLAATVGSIEAIDIETVGDSFFNKNNLTFSHNSGNSYTLTLNNDKYGVYDYAIGQITFNVTIENLEDPHKLTVYLYHTGFFHYDSDYVATDDKGYYYYEVLPLAGTNETNKYWLDRNIGAKSSKMYVNYSNSTNTVGDSKAAGGFYKVADYGGYTEDPNSKEDPRDIEILNSMCPKGYHIPSSTEMDAMRNAAPFTIKRETEGSSNYYTTYFLSQTGSSIDPSINVYFPKSRYINESSAMDDGIKFSSLADVNTGSNAAGYYWTATEASGQEKIEMGKWLQALSISGTSSSYINGSIYNHKMNVRAVAGTKPVADTKYNIDFNVKGATHVYLYTLDENKNKSALFAFPGRSLADPSTVRDFNNKGEDKYFHFSYKSNYSPKDLYVFFAYKDEDGKIIVIGKDGNHEYLHTDVPEGDGIREGAVIHDSSDFSLDNIEGWPVWIGYNYFFTWNSDFNSLTSTHIFKENYSVGTGSSFKIYIKNDINYTNPHLYCHGDDGELLGGWPGKAHEKDDLIVEQGEIYLVFNVPASSKKSYIIFNNGNNGSQAADIETTFNKDRYFRIWNNSQNGSEEKTIYKIYVNNQRPWSELAIYGGGDGNFFGGWPGKTTNKKEIIDGIEYYVIGAYEHTKDGTFIIFNNNDKESQTEDLYQKINRNLYYDITTNNITTSGVQRAEAFTRKIKIYAENQTGWDLADGFGLYTHSPSVMDKSGWLENVRDQNNYETINGVKYYVFEIEYAPFPETTKIIFNNGRPGGSNGASQYPSDGFEIYRYDDIYLTVKSDGITYK